MAERAFYKPQRVQEVDRPPRCERSQPGIFKSARNAWKTQIFGIISPRETLPEAHAAATVEHCVLKARNVTPERSSSHHPPPPPFITMESSAVLRQQSQSKICSDYLRMKNEHNKITADSKPFKSVSAPHVSKQSENKDPGISELGRKAPVRPGVSRLPVLAKSLHLQTPSDFSQSHHRWEEKPLAGKTKKKKPCTRPLPFNLSQPKSLRATNENQQPQIVPQSQSGTDAVKLQNNACNVRLKTQNVNSKPTKHQAVSNGQATENITHLPVKSGLPNTIKTPANLSSPLSAIPSNTLQKSAAPAEAPLSAETCLENMNLLSLKDPTKTLHARQNTELTPQVNFSKGLSDKGENFQSDHAALLSILRNEGVNATGLGSATPRSKSYNYAPQRVSIMKTRQKAVPTVKLVQFSPDPAALQSILQNEGVKTGGLVGATPRKSACLSGRGTSVYTAQRVPVRKNHAEATSGPVAAVLRETPLKKWTPQRVRDTRHQPMSAMKWHLSSQQSPYASTPGLKGCKTNLQPHQEEVVQRLFDDQEDEQNTNVTDKDPDTQTDKLSIQVSSTKICCEENTETSSDDTSRDEDEEQKVTGEQPFFQAPQRDSVIFFSTGKKLFRAPRFEKQESSALDQHGPVSSEHRKVQPVHEEMSALSQTTSQINPPVLSLHRDIVVQKSCGLSPAVALLRKRLPPLEELRMDEEVATYTSVSFPVASGFLPPQPRCGNPLAAILHLEESSRFVPISFDSLSGSSSPHNSPPEER